MPHFTHWLVAHYIYGNRWWQWNALSLMPSSTYKPTHMLLTCITVAVCLSSATLAVQVYVPVWSGVTWCSVTTFKPFWLVLVRGRNLLPGMRGRNVQVSSGIGDPPAAQSNVTFSPDWASITALVTDMNSGKRRTGDLGKTSRWPSGLYLDFFVSKFVAIHLPKKWTQNDWKWGRAFYNMTMDNRYITTQKPSFH